MSDNFLTPTVHVAVAIIAVAIVIAGRILTEQANDTIIALKCIVVVLEVNVFCVYWGDLPRLSIQYVVLLS